jgi:hypothetical protein
MRHNLGKDEDNDTEMTHVFYLSTIQELEIKTTKSVHMGGSFFKNLLLIDLKLLPMVD